MRVLVLGFLLVFSLNSRMGCFSSPERLPRLTLGLGGGEGMSRFLRTKATGWVNTAAFAVPCLTCWTGSAERWAGIFCHNFMQIQTLLPVSVHFQVSFLRFYLRFRCREVKLLLWHVHFLMILPSKDVISLLQPSPLQTPVSQEYFTHFFKSLYY